MEAPIQQDDVVVQTETPSVQQETGIPQGSQPQTTTPVPVENGQSTSHAPAEGTPDYETARQFKNLIKEFRSLKQSLETRSSAVPSVAQPQVQAITHQELLADPINAIKRMIAAETGQLKNEIPEVIQQRESVWRSEQARQEGLRLIGTNELVKRDPQGRERIDDILLEQDEFGNSLQEYSKSNPKHAAQLALKEYQTRFSSGARSASAPSKAQMTSTATAQTTGVKGTTDAEITSLYAQLASMPDLMKDEAFMTKVNAAIKKSDMETRMRS